MKKTPVWIIVILMLCLPTVSSLNVNWTQLTSSGAFDGASYFAYTTYHNNIHMCGGYDSTYYSRICWKSSDGINWTQTTSNLWGYGYGVTRPSMGVYNDKIYLIGGIGYGSFPQNKIFSYDGASWSYVGTFPYTIREESVISFNGKLWVLGGYCLSSGYDCSKSTFSSTNGINWTLETNNTNGGTSAVVFNNKLYWIGGGTNSNEVWKSSDGINWNYVSNFTTVSSSTFSVVAQNKIWILGIYNNNTAWYSSDGINWQEATNNGSIFPAGNGYGVSNKDNGLWVFGGTGGFTSVWFGDVSNGNVSLSVSSNPTQQGQNMTLSIKPTHPQGLASNLTLPFTGGCNVFDLTVEEFNVASGSTWNYTIDTSNAQWITNTNCTLYAEAEFSDGSTATSNNISWHITPSTLYPITPRIDPQTTIYGNQVIFYGKATYISNIASNLTLEIWDMNFTTLYYTTTLNNVPNGAEVELYRITQNSILWTGYQAGNYTYNLQATLINNNASISNSTLWTVINGETINQTNYEAQEYSKLPDDIGFNGIYSVTPSNENNAYTSIQNGSNLYIASWDITNPASIIYSRLNTALNQQSGRNGNPTSISSIDMIQGLNRLFIGTNNNLFIYDNASNNIASGLIYDFDKGFGIFENDGINDISAQSIDYAYVCQDGTGLENDDIYLYNYTLADFQDQMNSAPCISIKYDNWVYVHGGGNTNIKIWNPITQTLTSTIDFTKTISTRAYRDLLDVKNYYLSFIAGKDEIRRYDISNASNPILSGKCFTNETNEEIESIEAITNDEIIIGLYNPRNNVDIIYVCDFGNNDTYSATKGGYVAQYLSGIYGTKAWEITKANNQGKILMASGDRLEIFFYEKTNTSLQVNNPPIIDDYTFTPNTTICLNQIVDIEIIAHDPDTTPPADYLQYGVSCSGGGQPTTYSAYNLLTCSYSTAGTKTITIIVKDNHGLPSTASYDTITVNNCNQTNVTTIFFKIIDGNTANPVIGATINIYLNQTLIALGTTNNNGYADFNGLTPLTYYRATFTKDGYATKTEYFYTNNIRYVRALEPTNPNGTTRTLLTVTVQNSNNTLLEGVLVATLDPVTGASRYGLTDYSGTVYIFDIQPSNSFIVGARKEGYETTSVYASISNGEQKSVNIIMGQSRGANGYFPATPRQCADTIRGVWLCGNLSTTGIGNSCTQDTECISGRCSIGLTIRECSRFNYTLCDSQGINRGNTCIFKNMTRGIFTTIGDLILGNFLYVLLLVFLIVAGLIIKRSLSH